MTEYVTAEQQVEALKKWWAENGRYLIGGVVLGLAILFGWNGWKDYKENRGRTASGLYSQLEQAVAAGDAERARALQGQLVGDYSATPYAAVAEMTMARLAVENDDLATAELNLRSAIELADQEEIRELAELRLAYVLTAVGKAEEALGILDRDWNAAWTSLREELRGDAYQALGKLDAAREAYDKALLTAAGPASYLQLKRDALGKAAVAVGEQAS
jgi:predicted negative regulator of RcsB-dependent stress response